MTWIEQFLEATKGSESPRKFFYWAGLYSIAAVVKNQVYLDKFYYKLYPNIFVCFVARSGLRKGIPIAMAKAMVSEVNNTRIISGRSSIQAIIKDLSTAVTLNNGGPPLVDAVGAMFSSEFASFLVQDPQALTILTDLYDGHYNPDWVNTTKGGGAEKLKNVCLNLIGASNEVHFRDAVPDNALGGGFIGRTLIVYASDKACVNPLTERPQTLAPLTELAKYLRELGKLKGEFKWSQKGKELYNAWYQKFNEANENTDDTGTLDRIHDQILKAAMLISLSRKADLVLEVEDIAEAISECLRLVPGVRKVTMGAGKSSYAPGTAIVLKELIQRPDHMVSKTYLLQRFWGHFDTADLDKIIQTLLDSRAIKIEDKQIEGKPLGMREKWLILEPKVLENYEKKQEKK